MPSDHIGSNVNMLILHDCWYVYIQAKSFLGQEWVEGNCSQLILTKNVILRILMLLNRSETTDLHILTQCFSKITEQGISINYLILHCMKRYVKRVHSLNYTIEMLLLQCTNRFALIMDVLKYCICVHLIIIRICMQKISNNLGHLQDLQNSLQTSYF